MSAPRWLLVALLAVSTGMFATGAIAERSVGEEPERAHTEAAAGHVEESNVDPGEGDAVLGVNLESAPLVVLAVVVGLSLAGLVATHSGTMPGFLGAVAVIAIAWAILDVREFLHQLDESRTGIAAIALVIAALHLAAAAVSGRLARQESATT